MRAHEWERNYNELVHKRAAVMKHPSWEVAPENLTLNSRVIGTGGQGHVTVAYLKVASKMLPSKHRYDDNHRKTFFREMTIAAQVNHPNLLRFYGAILEPNEMIILTELMHISLREIIGSRNTNIIANYFFSIAKDIACALNYLHCFTPDPIIHRDLHSGNVLHKRTPNGEFLAKVCDYGLANFQKQVQTPIPKADYIAPESEDPFHQSPKMDIYSFGKLLEQMLIPYCDVHKVTPHPSLTNLIKMCLSQAPDQRPTAAQVINNLP